MSYTKQEIAKNLQALVDAYVNLAGRSVESASYYNGKADGLKRAIHELNKATTVERRVSVRTAKNAVWAVWQACHEELHKDKDQGCRDIPCGLAVKSAAIAEIDRLGPDMEDKA